MLRARMIEDIATSKIRSAAQGYVELIGRADWLPGPDIRAPLSGKNCVWYSYTIEARIGGGWFSRLLQRSGWEVLDRGASTELFQLSDDTGACIIDPESAQVYTTTQDVWFGSSQWPEGPIGASETVPLKPLGINMSMGVGRYRYQERRIACGTELYALGHFDTIGSDYAGDLSHDVAAILRSWKRDEAFLLRRYDSNKDGQLDEKEWVSVRRDAQILAKEHHKLNATGSTFHTLSETQDKRLPFILATGSPSGLVSRHRKRALLSLLGVAGTASFLAYILWLGYLS